MALLYDRYKVGTLESERWSAPLKADEAQTRLKNATASKTWQGPFRIGERGKELGPLRPRIEAVSKLITAIKRDKVGSVWRIQDANGKYLDVRKIHVKPAVMDTSGTKPVDISHTAIVQRFPKLHSWGICSCRNVAGSSTPSQHSYCNAEDWAGSKADMKALAGWLVRNAGKYNVSHVIYDRRIWTKGVGWSTYTGENPHTDHVHVDFTPQSPGKSCA